MSLELSDQFESVIHALSEKHSEQVLEVYQSSGDTFVRVKPDNLVEICKYLKDEHNFIYLSDIFGVDLFTSEKRFEVLYNMVSLKDQIRLFLKISLEEREPEVESVTSVWKSANWYEREVFDMFGIRFNNHPDMRRIYMPEDYDYYPLRKEFPLLGIPGSIELPSTTPDTE